MDEDITKELQPTKDPNSSRPASAPVHEQLMSKLFDFWGSVTQFPTVGPVYAFSKDSSSYLEEFITFSKILAEMKANTDEYWTLMNQALMQASKHTSERSPKEFSSKEDFENYRRAMIESFEETFTALFDSKEFAVIYGKLFSNQLDLLKVLQSVAERNLKTLNLPTRGEIDDILKDIHEIKKTVKALREEITEIASKHEPKQGVSA